VDALRLGQRLQRGMHLRALQLARCIEVGHQPRQSGERELGHLGHHIAERKDGHLQPVGLQCREQLGRLERQVGLDAQLQAGAHLDLLREHPRGTIAPVAALGPLMRNPDFLAGCTAGRGRHD
jgi:hypothetical protein